MHRQVKDATNEKLKEIIIPSFDSISQATLNGHKTAFFHLGS